MTLTRISFILSLWGDSMPEASMEQIPIKYNKDYYVVQANELIRSKQDDLTLLETKLIRLAISQVLQDDTDFKTYTCSVPELARFLGLSKNNVYRDIQDISMSLMKKSIFIKSKEPNKRGKYNFEMFHWVDYVRYEDGIITFRLSENLKPYLIGLDELFTKYGYGAVIELPTTYSIRLFELLATYRNMPYKERFKTNYTEIPIEHNEFIFTMDYLREYFNCNDKYDNSADFVSNVIDKAVKAICKKTFMRVSYRKVKEGKFIKYIVFKFDDWHDPNDNEFLKRLEAVKTKWNTY